MNSYVLNIEAFIKVIYFLIYYEVKNTYKCLVIIFKTELDFFNS